MSQRDPTDLLEEQEKAEASRLARHLRREQEISDFKWLTAHKQGRRFLWRLLDLSGQLRSSMTGNSQTFANEGARTFGLALMAEFHEHSIDAYAVMVKENA